MAVIVPTRLADALEALAENPDAHLLCGGTDLMVEVNHGSRRPATVIALHRIPDLRGWSADGRIGATTTYTDLLDASPFPGLAQASRTVGSPQIRNAGTIGGNLGTSSPAGDTLPVLAALDASVELASVAGSRRLTVHEFITGPKRNARRPDELIVAVHVAPAEAEDTQEYLKVGTRNAMVIAVASCAVVVRPATRSVRIGLGSVGPTPLRARAAEQFGEVYFDNLAAAAAEIGRLTSGAARPIDDHRSTAAYRRHAVGVLAARAIRRAAA